ncbi:hypothetical protein STEG23_027125, partial [Scotinomys teguina]
VISNVFLRQESGPTLLNVAFGHSSIQTPLDEEAASQPLTPRDLTLLPILCVSPPSCGSSHIIGPRTIQMLLEEEPLCPGDLTLPPILCVSPLPSGPSHFLGPNSICTPLKEEAASQLLTPRDHTLPPHPASISTSKWPQLLHRTQEHPHTLGGRGPRSIQTPLEEENPEAPRNRWRKRTKKHSDTTRPRGPRSTQIPLEEESLPRTKEHPDTIGSRGPRST